MNIFITLRGRFLGHTVKRGTRLRGLGVGPETSLMKIYLVPSFLYKECLYVDRLYVQCFGISHIHISDRY